MNLVVDIGNSNLKWTIVDGDTWKTGDSVPLQDDIGALLDRIWVGINPPRSAVVSNVSGKHLEGEIRKWCCMKWGFEPRFFRSTGQFRTLRNEYRNPAQLGCDRWAAIIGARSLAGGDLCVVDCGTAVTIDALTSDDRFIGGIIFPGAALVRDSLLTGTADISEKRADFREVTGRTTAECVSGGSHFGVAGAVDRVLLEMESVLDRPTLFITGGGARFLIPFLHHILQPEPDLVLIGLAQTLD